MAVPFTAILSIAGKLLDKTPNYDEKKKQEFIDLKLAYLQEKVKPYAQRDDDLLMNLKDKLDVWIAIIDKDVV